MTEAEIIQDVIDQIKMPKEILGVDFSFTEDSTGMPTVWINLHIFDELHPSRAQIRKLSTLMREISTKILETNAVSWPFIHFVAD